MPEPKTKVASRIAPARIAGAGSVLLCLLAIPLSHRTRRPIQIVHIAVAPTGALPASYECRSDNYCHLPDSTNICLFGIDLAGPSFDGGLRPISKD